MLASYTWVLPLFYYPIGLRLENLSASGTFWVLGCVWCLRAALTPVHKHPIKDCTLWTPVYVLYTWTAGRTGSTGCVCVYPFVFADEGCARTFFYTREGLHPLLPSFFILPGISFMTPVLLNITYFILISQTRTQNPWTLTQSHCYVISLALRLSSPNSYTKLPSQLRTILSVVCLGLMSRAQTSLLIRTLWYFFYQFHFSN